MGTASIIAPYLTQLDDLAILTKENGGKNSSSLSVYTFSNLNVDDGLIIVGTTYVNASSISGITVGGQACSKKIAKADTSDNTEVEIWFFDNSTGTLSGPTEDVVVTLSDSADACSCYTWTVNRPASYIGISHSGNGSNSTDTITFSGEDASGDSIFFIAGCVNRDGETQSGDGTQDANNSGGSGDFLSDTYRRYIPNDDGGYPAARQVRTTFVSSGNPMAHVLMEVTP